MSSKVQLESYVDASYSHKATGRRSISDEVVMCASVCIVFLQDADSRSVFIYGKRSATSGEFTICPRTSADQHADSRYWHSPVESI